MITSNPSGSPTEWEHGQLLLGDFEVQCILGQGGMGKVYLVRSLTTSMEFAVKRALVRDDNNRQNFLSELQTWIDLPEHPNIAACRFFRTIGDEIAIFSEYVDGGTLADWIQNRRLTTLEQILDVAIQFAWGLQALHEHGQIHQDVKPGNALMTPEGIAKVTDFGLAQARLRDSNREFHSPTSAQSVLVSFGGMTPAYCSPEQAAKQPISRKTDIWSWGVGVLDMFYGGVSCRYGQTAGESLEALEQYGAHRPTNLGQAEIPKAVADVLRKSFQRDPKNRWMSIADAANALTDAYRDLVGAPYSRTQPRATAQAQQQNIPNDRKTALGGEWTDPIEWIQKALFAAGLDPSRAAVLNRIRADSPRARAIGDLAAYDQAYRLFEQLIASGRGDLRGSLVALCMEKALVHFYSDDLSGAIEQYDHAIGACEALVKAGKAEVTNDLATAYTNQASVICMSGDLRSGLAVVDRAIKIREHLVNDTGRQEFADDLAASYFTKATALADLKNHEGAVDLFESAIEIYRGLVAEEGANARSIKLALAYLNQGGAASDLGDHRRAAKICDCAIAIYEHVIGIEQRREYSNHLATAYMNKANAVSALGDARSAAGIYDLAIEIRERLVIQEGRREFSNDLAMVCQNKAGVLSALADSGGAEAMYERPFKFTNDS